MSHPRQIELDTAIASLPGQARAAAEADSEHKRVFATAALLAKVAKVDGGGGARSADEAKWMAESDDTVADAYHRKVLAASEFDSTKLLIMALRSQLSYDQTLMNLQMERDKFHAFDRRTP